MTARRTAYWTRKQPADRTVCWRTGCTDSSTTQHPRLRGAYCETHTAATLADADRLNAMEGAA